MRLSGSSFLFILWMGPEEPVLPIIDYTVEYKLGFESNWTGTGPTIVPLFNVTELYPNARYQVSGLYMYAVCALYIRSDCVCVHTKLSSVSEPSKQRSPFLGT